MKLNLSFQLIEVKDINDKQRQRMFELMVDSYNKVKEDNFLIDLNKKNWAGIISDEDELVQGFTTFAINPGGSGTDSYHVLFSGDTIIAHEYWGSQVMMKGWCRAVGSIIAADPHKKWYWYLLSKGHRTYMYLPLFFEKYYPNPDSEDDNLSLQRIAAAISPKIFGDDWKPNEGIIRFEHSQGELKPEWVSATFQKKGSKYAQYFLERNPHFHQGEELVCIAPIYPENMKRSAKDHLIEGMKQAVDLNFHQL